MNHRADTIFSICIFLILCAYAWTVGEIAPGFLSYSFAGMTAAYVYWFRGWLAVGAGTALLYALYAAKHPAPSFVSGLAAFACLLSRWARARGDERGRIERIGALPILIIGLSNVAEIPQLLTYFLRQTEDARLLAADRLLFLGSDPTYLAGRAVVSAHLREFLRYWYLALGFGMIVAMIPGSLDAARLAAYWRAPWLQQEGSASSSTAWSPPSAQPMPSLDTRWCPPA